MKEVHYKKGQPQKYYEEEYAKLMQKHDVLVKLYEQCEEKENEIAKLHHTGEIEDEDYFREMATISEKYEYIADSMEKLSEQAKELKAILQPEDEEDEFEEEEEESDALADVPAKLKDSFLTLLKNVHHSIDSLKELINKIDEGEFADEQPFKDLREKADYFVVISAKNFTIIHQNIDNPKIDEDFLYALGAFIDISMKYLTAYYDKLVLDANESKHGNYKEYQKAREANDDYLGDAKASQIIMLWDCEERVKKNGLKIDLIDVVKDE